MRRRRRRRKKKKKKKKVMRRKNKFNVLHYFSIYSHVSFLLCQMGKS
jgi:hypothetical protein